jgi:hypothetical protein
MTGSGEVPSGVVFKYNHSVPAKVLFVTSQLEALLPSVSPFFFSSSPHAAVERLKVASNKRDRDVKVDMKHSYYAKLHNERT